MYIQPQVDQQFSSLHIFTCPCALFHFILFFLAYNLMHIITRQGLQCQPHSSTFRDGEQDYNPWHYINVTEQIGIK